MKQKEFQKFRHAARLIVTGVGVSIFLKAQDSICPICRKRLYLKDITIDHVYPLSFIKKNSGNILLCHYACNQEKGDRLPTNEEINMLQLVNDRLGFDSHTGRYAYRHAIVRDYQRKILHYNMMLDRGDTDAIIQLRRKIDIIVNQIGQYMDFFER